MNKAIDYILFIDTFEQQYFAIRGMLQSPHIEYHMKTIGIDQSLSNRFFVEHNFLNNIKYIYQHTGKCNDQQNIKYIIYAAMVSTP